MTTLQKIRTLNWFDFLRKIKDILTNLNSSSFEEAPIDGNQYARQDGDWSEVTGGGGTQDLQSVLDEGHVAESSITLIDSNINIGATSDINNKYAGMSVGGFTIRDVPANLTTQLGNGILNTASLDSSFGVVTIDITRSTVGDVNYNFNGTKPAGNYTIATLDDIPTIVDASASVTGVVNNTSLQELGGVDKLINGVRIGKGVNSLSNNTLLGTSALTAITTGNYNTAIGSNTLSAVTTGQLNVGVGSYALNKITTSSNNTAVGYTSLYNATTGSSNTAIGSGAGYTLGDGGFNVAIGSVALQLSVSGVNNVAIGASAMKNTTTPSVADQGSVGIGSNALLSNTTGNGVAIGQAALRSQTTGIYNIGIGVQAGSGITTGSGNVILADTGNITFGGGITTGSNNMILAPNSGNTTGVTTGSGNVVVGKVTGLSSSLANTVVVSDGVGTQRLVSDSSNLTTLPNQTTTLITADGTGKAIITKEYIPTAIETNTATNSTTVILSSATLSSTYPSALTGFKVHCLSIIAGGLIYEKTSTGWCQYTAIVTA